MRINELGINSLICSKNIRLKFKKYDKCIKRPQHFHFDINHEFFITIS